MEWLKGKKAYIVAVLMVLVSILNLVTGEMSFSEFFNSGHVQLLLEGLGIGALRAGMVNSK